MQRRTFNSWSQKVQQASEQQSPWATTTEQGLPRAHACNGKNHCHEKPTPPKPEEHPPTTWWRGLAGSMETQHSHRQMSKNKSNKTHLQWAFQWSSGIRALRVLLLCIGYGFGPPVRKYDLTCPTAAARKGVQNLNASASSPPLLAEDTGKCHSRDHGNGHGFQERRRKSTEIQSWDEEETVDRGGTGFSHIFLEVPHLFLVEKGK